jgi:hypothetical protein
MRILYSAIDQAVPGPHGGSVHVRAVAEGLASLGHEVQALVSPGPGGQVPASDAVMWSPMAPPFGSRRLRLTRAGSVLEAGRALNADVIIERYYNFGGEGILAAGKLDAVAVLEVNAPDAAVARVAVRARRPDRGTKRPDATGVRTRGSNSADRMGGRH